MDIQHQDSPAWRMQIVIAFVVALGLTTVGIFFLPVDLWTKGYLVMGVYFTLSTAFSLSKSLRDSHESSRLHNKIDSARTEQMLREYGEAA